MTPVTPLPTSTMTVDDTTVRLIAMLTTYYEGEPDDPDPDLHPHELLPEVARAHFEWSRHVDALRLLIGTRLVNLALDAVQP